MAKNDFEIWKEQEQQRLNASEGQIENMLTMAARASRAGMGSIGSCYKNIVNATYGFGRLTSDKFGRLTSGKD